MESTLLKTGEVAGLLGVSRQHVVDLCDAGKLEHIRVGAHRRIPRTVIEPLLDKPLTEDKAKSLWLHGAVLGELVKDPETTIATARTNLAMIRARQPRAGVYVDGWEKVLDGGVDEIARTLVGRDTWSSELRANTPFAGVLSDSARRAVLRSFRRTHDR